MIATSPSFPVSPVREVVSRVHRAGSTGVVEVSLPEGVRRLVLRRGELFLPANHPLARSVGRLLPLWPPRPGGAGALAEVRGLMARIAFLVGSWDGDAIFLEGVGRGGRRMVGPLPTRLLLMEWAASRGTDELAASLGEEHATLVAVAPEDEAAALAARLLDPQAAVMLSRLSRPTRLGDLLRQSGGTRSRVLADLVRLEAAGLIRARQPAGDATEPPPVIGRAVAPDVLRRHAARVARELDERPLALDAASHRSRLADLLGRSRTSTAYELLGVGPAASDEEIHAAFDRLVRLAHPLHAARLDLAAGERPLWVLFEQATAAYLTLSQPERRLRYDREMAGAAAPTAPDPGLDPQRQLARSYYERAEALIEAEDFHFAVELLKEAVHTHPRPEYYVLLGRVQASNPNWLRHAMDSYRRAIDLGADDARTSVALGRLCEEMDQLDEAARHYRAALARDPGETEARAGLARLTGGGGAGGAAAAPPARGGAS